MPREAVSYTNATTLQFSGVELLESYGFTQTDVNELAVDVTDLLEADGDDPEMKFGVMNGTSTDADGNTVAYLQAIALGDRYYAVTLDKGGTEGGRVSVSRVTDNSTLPDFADTGRSE